MEKKKRYRRTKIDLNNDLLGAVKELIEEVGFNNLTIKAIVEKANIQASVFYNRFKDLDDLFDKLVREYDYFLNDAVRIDPEQKPVQNYSGLMNALIDSLEHDNIMQKLLIWELCSDNYIIRRTSATRELNSKYLTDYFETEFKDLNIHGRVLSSLIIGGIYYLILHKGVSNFFGVDFSKKENIDLLKDTIDRLSKSVFSKSNAEFLENAKERNASEMIQVAKSLLKNNVDLQIIKEATGLTEEALQSLMKNASEVKEVKRRGRKRKNA